LLIAGLVSEQAQNTALGWITFAGLAVAMVVQPMAGAVSDRSRFRWGKRRPFVVAGTVGSVGGLAILAGAPNLALVVVGYVVTQIIFNVALGAYQGLIPDQVPVERRGLAAGIKNFTDVAGVVIVALALPGVIGPNGEQANIGWTIVIGGLLAGLVVTVLVVKERPGDEVDADEDDPDRADRKGGLVQAALGAFAVNIREHKPFAWMVGGRLAFVIALTSIQTFSLFYIRDVLQPADPVGLWGALTAAIGGSILICTPFAGWIADRVGRKPVLIVSGLVAAGGSALLLLARDPGLVIAFGVIVGIGIGFFLSANWALATDLVPRNDAARFMGFTNLATAGGAAIARLNGPVIDWLNGFQPLLGYSFLIGGVAVLFAVGGLLTVKIQEPGRA
jgi:Na+/melibiose symporter-like transporter